MEKKTIKAGIAQRSYSFDIEANRTKNIDSICRLAESGADLIILSELHDGPYFCQTEDVDNFNLAHKVDADSPEVKRYAELARRYGVVIVTSFFEKRAPGLYHNTAVVLEKDGSIAGIYRKMHIPDDPAYYEKFYFTPGDLGFRPVRTSVGMLGVCVCWAQGNPEEEARQREAWITVQRGHAVANGLPVISVNRVGFEPDSSGLTNGIAFWGSSFAAGPQGEFLFKAPDTEECLQIVDVDLGRGEQVRRWWPFLRDRRIDFYNPILKRFND